MPTIKLKEDTVVFSRIINQIVEVIENTDASILYKKPSEFEWSVMQIASHVIEAVNFWVEDLEALLIVPGAKWGRNHEHVRRLAAVEENYVASLSKQDIIDQLQSLISLVSAAIAKVTDEDLIKTAPSYNPNFDGKPLTFLIDHLILKHVESHLGQMKCHLAKVQ